MAVLGLLACFIYSIAIFYLKRQSKLNFKSWDVQTITPGDYSVEYEISQHSYDWFLRTVYPADEANGVSPAFSLKNYMKNEIERQLDEHLIQKKATSSDNEHLAKLAHVKIADIVFAFNNADLINLLKLRGNAIMNQKYDKMREIENQITLQKKDHYDHLTRPVCAFVTFEEEDAYILAQDFEPHVDIKGKRMPSTRQFLDADLYFIEATEPTNIIWENRHITSQTRFKRTIHAVLLIALLVLASFGVIYYCKVTALKIAQKYPVVDTATVTTSYGSELPKYAFLEYQRYYVTEVDQYFLTGPLQVYCTNIGTSKLGAVDTTDKTITINGTTYSAPICEQYGIDLNANYALSNAVSQMIVAINFVLRLFIIKCIMYIGKPTESEQTELITDGVFIVQFFNTAILLLLANANLAEQGAVMGFLFNGKLADFNATWFNDIGYSMIYAMMFNIFWPMMEFCAYFGIRLAFRVLDRGICSCSTMKTKKTTLQQYVDIYSGPTYFIHYKYSSVLNITFVTFLYGLGIPLLFPVAAI